MTAMTTPRQVMDEKHASAAEIFRAQGWSVRCVASAMVEETAKLERPDLLLLGDEALPTLDALFGARIPIAVMSADEQLRERCIAGGATAFLQLPLKESSLAALKKLIELRRSTPRVLISEGDLVTVRKLERDARREGLDPISAHDGPGVIELAKEVRPHTIVLDTDQRDVLALLKADPETRDIRVVMLTGIEDQYMRHHCFALGADDYVVKPIDPLFFIRIARRIGEDRCIS
jgi:two-component system response regulator AdeR